MNSVNIAFLGNPNCGKTTLFNAYTGLTVKVANWPGVTVEKISGKMTFNGAVYNLTDLPGTYSLDTYSKEEEVTKNHILSNDVDVIINVVDATNLERNLYLTLQLLELGKPVIIALNMMDVAKKRGIVIDTQKLGRILGTKVVLVSGKKRMGLDELIFATNTVKKPCYSGSSDDKFMQIETIISKVLICQGRKELTSERFDKILTHKYLGMPIFFLIMALIFFLTFNLGDYLKIFFENWLESFVMGVQFFLEKHNIHSMIISLITEGIIPGVGGVITFLPNIFILFLSLAVLEDSGYMSRVCYIMDNTMKKVGLSGKAFIPMILGFGCTVPAAMSARTLSDRGDRIKTILAVPFMSCSAKLPVYVMLSKLFFGKFAAVSAYSMYLIGFFVAIFVLYLMSKKKDRESNLLIELPDYRLPDIKTVYIYVIEKVKDYLAKAGTTIFLASVLLWFFLHFGRNGITEDIKDSIGAKMGMLLAPLMKPAGLGDWRIILSLIWGIAAKEAVVSGMSVLYGIQNISSSGGMSELFIVMSQNGFTAVSAYSMMLFCLLYTPCIASITTIRREIKSAKITYIALIMQLLIAWGISTVVYQVGRMIF